MLPPHDLQQPIGQRRRQRAEQLGMEFCRFRELLGKLGSGERTSTGLTQAEAREAIERILFPFSSSSLIAVGFSAATWLGESTPRNAAA